MTLYFIKTELKVNLELHTHFGKNAINIFLVLFDRPDRLWSPPKPPIQWVLGALSPGIKRQGREADHSS
jgi:hypothetical protein